MARASAEAIAASLGLKIVRIASVTEGERSFQPVYRATPMARGEALAAQRSAHEAVQRQSADGLLQICLEPLALDSRAEIETDDGLFCGRDHRLTVAFASEP